MQPVHLTFSILLVIAEVVVIARALLRPHREPMSRLAWVLVIIAAPIIGMLAYLLLGEARVSEGRRIRGARIEQSLPRPPGSKAAAAELAQGKYAAPFALARSVNGLDPTSGNRASLAADSDTAIDQMVADIDAAKSTVHASFYIWLEDHNGLKVKQALIRAAKRGIPVRVLADALGSRGIIRSVYWDEMINAGVQAREALPVGSLLWTMIRGRVDLRNHRKSLVIDNRIAWIGSQNAADPQFRVKPDFAPWVDIMTRWDGAVARQAQYLFVADWMSEHGEDLSALLTAPLPRRKDEGDVIAQIIGTGPTLRFDAMPTTFAEVIHSARNELVVTTPYFVPDEMLLFALTAAARRGVRTVLILPKRIDSRIVAATCKSYFGDLLNAGVELYLYRGGLLHAKTMVVDRTIALVGSANLDRRSFELNFENNVLFYDRAFAAQIRERQDQWLANCDRVLAEEVLAFTFRQRLWQNLLAMLSPLL